jgi:16S rRNA (guanine527-N7)-methyltransferase
MDPARIALLLQPFLAAAASAPTAEEPRVLPLRASNNATQEPAVLSPAQLHSISTYIYILIRWNARINLTAVRDQEEIVTRHFGESLFTARHLFPSAQTMWGQPPSAPHLIDVGSGAGFPGLPIKIWAPHIQLTLIESNQKKAAFLREVIRTVTFTYVDVFAGRAQNFTARADVVTLRAVEHFDAILPIAARLVAPAGRLALLIGRAQVDHAHKLASDLRWSQPIPIPLSYARVLLIAASEPRESR